MGEQVDYNVSSHEHSADDMVRYSIWGTSDENGKEWGWRGVGWGVKGRKGGSGGAPRANDNIG